MVSEVISDINTLIIAVSGLVGAIGAILTLFAKTRKIGNSLKETDKWILENEFKLVEIMDAVHNLTPEKGKEYVAQFRDLVIKYKGDLDAAKAELERIYGPLGDIIPDSVK